MPASVSQALTGLFYTDLMRMTMNAQLAKIFPRSESGATAIEYGLIAGLIFVAIVGGVGALGQGVMNVLYNKIETLF